MTVTYLHLAIWAPQGQKTFLNTVKIRNNICVYIKMISRYNSILLFTLHTEYTEYKLNIYIYIVSKKIRL